jgi:hypothetical protein
MNKHKLLLRLHNSSKNVSYNDFLTLIEAFGFRRTRGNGSHNIYKRKGIPDDLNIQSNKGEAKPYQVKHFLSIIEKHKLRLEDE